MHGQTNFLLGDRPINARLAYSSARRDKGQLLTAALEFGSLRLVRSRASQQVLRFDCGLLGELNLVLSNFYAAVQTNHVRYRPV